MFVQLQTPLPVHVVDRGPGLAFAVIDYGPEHNLIWVTALDDSGEIWCAPNPKVRLARNWTMGRGAGDASSAREGECSPAVARMPMARGDD
ncbi:hypothetical protein [Pelagerythrobacter marensis]|uniref:Uncharacterized protein n=1 Tax=Pelagerythrobacter marensis TaxID=543877 RepID=A0A0G3X540_9SPHN|nr:hypothetical protein [Pelagerythrobacter marensis]AKM06297.1 hypothetical protein AM2010_208 [Pelagerythrobacter marensis]